VKKIILVFVMLLVFSGVSFGANTVTTSGKWTTITDFDSDFLYSTSVGSAVKIQAVKFIPGAAGDFIILRRNSITGVIITRLESLDGEPRIDQSFQGQQSINISIDFSENTLSSGATLIIQRY
jgi:hypothetical protein